MSRVESGFMTRVYLFWKPIFSRSFFIHKILPNVRLKQPEQIWFTSPDQHERWNIIRNVCKWAKWREKWRKSTRKFICIIFCYICSEEAQQTVQVQWSALLAQMSSGVDVSSECRSKKRPTCVVILQLTWKQPNKQEIAQWKVSTTATGVSKPWNMSESRKTYTKLLPACAIEREQQQGSEKEKKIDFEFKPTVYVPVKWSQFSRSVLHALRLLLFYDVTKLILCLHCSHLYRPLMESSMEKLEIGVKPPETRNSIRQRWKSARKECLAGPRQTSMIVKNIAICIVYMVMRLRRHLSVAQHHRKEKNKAAEGEAENINTQNLRLNEIHIWFLRYLYVVIKLSKLWSENFHCYRFFSAVAALDSFLSQVCRRFRLCVGSFFFIWLREQSDGFSVKTKVFIKSKWRHFIS